jgi:hypothetical protein
MTNLLGLWDVGAILLAIRILSQLEPYFETTSSFWTGRRIDQRQLSCVERPVGSIIEYYGPGLDCLSAMDRHLIANMGAELGATTSVFPSNAEVRGFLRS